MAQAERSELYQYIQDSLSILRTSLNLARNQQEGFYRVVAVQLRLLLCDTTRLHGRMMNTALLYRYSPDIRLLPPPGMQNPDKQGVPLQLDDWLQLELPVAGKPTIRQLIRQVCDQDGGVHVDQRATIQRIDPAIGREWILRIGELVVEQIAL